MKRSMLTVLISLTLAGTADARIWRPNGREPIRGDFLEVQGDSVIVRTPGGTERLRYDDLSPTDQAVVRAELEKQGKASEIQALEGSNPQEQSPGSAGKPQLPPGFPSFPGFGGTAPDQQGESGNNKTWTDINGNQLTADFVRVDGNAVILRVDGREQRFPVGGFSAADQEWLAQQSNEDSAGSSNAAPATPGAAGGTQPGMPGPPGIDPNVPPGYSGMLPGDMGRGRPGFPNRPGMPGFPGGGPMAGGGMPGFPVGPGAPTFPGSPGSSGGYGPAGGGMSGPNHTLPGTAAGPGSQPGPGSGYSGSGGIAGPGFTAPGPGAGSGFTGGAMDHGGPGSSLADHGPPDFHQPSFQPPAFEPPPIPDIPVPSWGRMNNGMLECENCGATFTESSGLSEGDSCPQCSGGGSSPRFRSYRGVVKLVIGIIALAAAGVSAVWKKVSG